MYEKNALNNFKDVLGKYCAINQFVELSKRCFLVEHQNEIQKRDTFVKLATEYAVTLTNYDAVHGNTAAEVIVARADHNKEHLAGRYYHFEM